MKHPYQTEDLIVASATPRGRSALAVIRSSGPGSVESFANIFSKPEILKNSQGNQVFHGWLQDETGQKIDEVMATVFRAPKSYTGQDAVEISCHGNPIITDRIVELFRQAGFRDANPGEFTFRAFHAGKINLTQAEAVKEIIEARTQKASALAVARLSGSVSTVVNEANELLKKQAAIASLILDYPEDEIEAISFNERDIQKARQLLQCMIDTWNTGKLYQNGLRIAIIGPVNAGKSSLFNLFLKEERSIVTESPGTTRDWLEAWLNMDGIPVCLVDTAGLRQNSNDPIEIEGIRRARELVSNSDIILLVVDASEGIKAATTLVSDEFADETKVIRVWNKADMAPNNPSGWLAVSALTGIGFSELQKAINTKALLNGQTIDGNAPIIDSARQKDLMQTAVEALLRFEENDDRPVDLKAQDLWDALDALGELVGEVTRFDILNMLFSEFCVGK